MSLLLTTSSVPRNQRLAYWTDMICDVYVQLECDAPRAREFNGSIRSHSLAHLKLSVVESGPQRVLRTPGKISRASEDYFLVSIQTAAAASSARTAATPCCSRETSLSTTALGPTS